MNQPQIPPRREQAPAPLPPKNDMRAQYMESIRQKEQAAKHSSDVIG